MTETLILNTLEKNTMALNNFIGASPTEAENQLNVLSMDKYIVPIFGQAQQGCGFFVGNYFITGYHVIEEYEKPLYIWFDSKKYVLDKNKAIKTSCSRTNSDFAVFSFEKIDSPLELADYEPAFGQMLHCITYDTIVAKNSKPNLLDIFAKTDHVEKKSTSVVVREEKQGDFFACDTESVLREGNSGCPVLDTNNKIVGLLVGGTDVAECCIFQSTKPIRNILNL